MKKIIPVILAALLSACGKPAKNDNEIRVGTMSGPETELVELAKKFALEKYNLIITIVEFNDYHMPNIALNEGSIDANIFQHLPYLEEDTALHHYAFAVAGKTFVYPMGLYSQKVKSIKDLPNNCIISIPNDPTNETRSLLLLQNAGVIKLNNTKNATPLNITSNPKKCKIKEIDPPNIPRTLEDVDLAAIITNYAIQAGLLPSKDALFLENKNSPYANLIVVKENEKNTENVKHLVEAMHSKPVVTRAEELFKGQAIPAW